MLLNLKWFSRFGFSLFGSSHYCIYEKEVTIVTFNIYSATVLQIAEINPDEYFFVYYHTAYVYIPYKKKKYTNVLVLVLVLAATQTLLYLSCKSDGYTSGQCGSTVV